MAVFSGASTMSKQTQALKLALEGAANYIDALGGDSRKYRQALAEQPAQQQEPLDKNGSPCAEFWDWLPKAYNFEGAGNFTKYNMEVAFLAGKQSASAQEPVEYWTVADGWVSEQAEVPAFVWVEPDFWEHCKRVNCGTAYRLPAPGRQPLYTSPPASKPLTDEQIMEMYNEPRSDAEMIAFARAIEAAHGIKE